MGPTLHKKQKCIVKNNEVPSVQIQDKVQKVIIEISKKRLGATAVLEGEKILGIITDGDLRRMLEKGVEIEKILAKDIMNNSPKSISSSALAIEALKIMEQHNISQLLVVENENYIGIIHLHDILKEGIA